jgi:hypothetical protein
LRDFVRVVRALPTAVRFFLGLMPASLVALLAERDRRDERRRESAASGPPYAGGMAGAAPSSSRA